MARFDLISAPAGHPDTHLLHINNSCRPASSVFLQETPYLQRSSEMESIASDLRNCRPPPDPVDDPIIPKL
jgi:hypothetical protein